VEDVKVLEVVLNEDQEESKIRTYKVLGDVTAKEDKT
jgi:hypothetical protein